MNNENTNNNIFNVNKSYSKKRPRTKYKHSYGVIGFNINEQNKINYLMVKRKFTYSFLDFLYGKYKLTDKNYIGKIFQRMTNKEKFYLYSNDNFNDLWKLTWGENTFFKSSYYCGLIKFLILKKGYYINKSYVSLNTILKNNKSDYKYCEWGFPKGRKDGNETYVQSALREFEEETGVSDYNLLDMPYICENHIGVDNILYKTKLYFVYINNTNLKNNIFDKQEISKISWFSKQEIYDYIRNYQSSIVKTIENAEKNILCLNGNFRINTKIQEDYKNFIKTKTKMDLTKIYKIEKIFNDDLYHKKFLKHENIFEADKIIETVITDNLNILGVLTNENENKLDYEMTSCISLFTQKHLKKQNFNEILKTNNNSRTIKYYLTIETDINTQTFEENIVREKESYDNLRSFFERYDPDEDDSSLSLEDDSSGEKEKEDYSAFRMLCDDDD